MAEWTGHEDLAAAAELIGRTLQPWTAAVPGAAELIGREARRRSHEAINARAAGLDSADLQALRVKLTSAAHAINDLAVYIGEHHQPIVVQVGIAHVNACSTCYTDDGSHQLYPCRTVRLVQETRRHVLRLTDGRKVGRHG